MTFTRRRAVTFWVLSLLLWLAALGLAAAAAGAPQAGLDNAGCLRCHDSKAHKLKVEAANGKSRALLAVAPDKYGQGVHGKMQCVACHTGITDNPPDGQGHQRDASLPAKSQGCAECHQALWDTARKDNTASSKPALGGVVDNIEAYRKSFHARASKEEPNKVNATCDNCHDTHSFRVPTKDSPAHAQWRLDSSALVRRKLPHRRARRLHGVGARQGSPGQEQCEVGGLLRLPQRARGRQYLGHADQAGHHRELRQLPLRRAPSPTRPPTTVRSTRSATPTPPSASTATAATPSSASSDPKSTVHANNRLKTCQNCHSGKKDRRATAGFATLPAARPHRRLRALSADVARRTKLMVALLLRYLRLLLGAYGACGSTANTRSGSTERCARTSGPRHCPAARTRQPLPPLQRDLAPRAPDVRAQPDDADADRHAAVLSRRRVGAMGDAGARRAEGGRTRSTASARSYFVHRVLRPPRLHGHARVAASGATFRWLRAGLD